MLYRLHSLKDGLMLMIENSLSDLLESGLEYHVLSILVSITLLFILCRFFLFVLSKAFESVCDWLEYKLASRRVRKTFFNAGKKNKLSSQSVRQLNHNAASKAETTKTNSLNSSRKGRIIDAQNVLRRNAEAYTNRHKN